MEKKIKIKDCDKDKNLNGAIIIYEKMPGEPPKYVTEKRFQEAIASIRKDMITEERLQEVVNGAVASIRKDMVTHDELHQVVHQVVGDAINGLETRMTKLILSLKN
jgi:hypothetical protein